MKKPILYGLGLVLAAPLFAQGAIYSPQDLASAEGQYYAYYFFRYSNSRWQNCDGENRGKVAVIGSIAVRLDGTYTYNTSYGMGRTWSNVQLMISEGDLKTFSNTFTANATTTPTTVFSSGWSLPTVSGLQTPKPQPWGGKNGELKVPFKSTWVYTGKGDILTDWQYTGGKLANNASWSGSSGRYYMIDSYGSASPYGSAGSSYTSMPTTRLNNNSTGVTTRCNDSEHGTSTTGAYCYVTASLYGDKYPVDNYRGRLLFYAYSYYTGYENPVIHGLSLKPNTAGVDLGTGCNKLHLDAPIVAIGRTTMPRSYSSSGYSGYRFSLVKWMSAMANLTVAAQAAWADSSTNAFALSQARQATLPSGPPKEIKRLATYHYTKANTTGFGPYTTYIYNPAYCYSVSK